MTPPRRQASIWQTAIASAWRSCLNITRLWTCSPVATRIGATPRAIAAWPRMSSGAGRLLDPVRVELARAAPSRRSPRRRPSAGSRRPPCIRSGPISSRTIAARRRSSSTSAPDLELERASSPRRAPRGRAAGSCRRRSRASRPTSCRPDSRPAGARPRAPRGWGPARAAARGLAPAVRASADVAEVDERDDAPRASCRTSSFQSGLPAVFAKRSQTALTTAAVARWITPFSGPIQRSWLSPTSVAPERAHVGEELVGRDGPTTSGRSASTAGDARPPSRGRS